MNIETVRLVWSGRGNLAERLRVPFSRMHALYASHGRPIKLILAWDSRDHVSVQSEMHDVGARTEVGTLRFEEVHGREQGEIVGFEWGPVNSPLEAFALGISENSMQLECGVMLRPENGESLIITPGDYPYTLAVARGSWRFGSEPEYPLSAYRASKLGL